MTNILEFEVKKSGFPVKIGGIELWFDNSYEGLVNFFQAKEIIDKKDKEIAKKAKGFEGVDENTLDYETAKKIIDLKKENVSTFYDNVFGEGSFDKIYEKNPNLNELEDLIPVLDIAISKVIIEKENERAKAIENKKNEYLKKKSKKK